MDPILIGVIVFVALCVMRFIASDNSAPAEGIADKVVVKKKQCPPHQWFWQEQVDQNGVKQGERIVCKVCGPLSKDAE